MIVDFQTASLALLVVIGAVNVVGFYYPNLDSKIKFALSIVIAFLVSFIPAEIGSVILEKLRDAITVAVAASGAYKLFQVAGQRSNQPIIK